MSAVRCDAVLASEEATAVVGDGYAGPAVQEPRPGVTSCEWQGDDSARMTAYKAARDKALAPAKAIATA